ncbi:hypothetical protein [Acinetobacter baumannii]
MKYLLLALSLMSIVSCSNETNTTMSSTQSEKVEFNIRSEDNKRDIKRVVEVDLPKRIDENQIKLIAEEVKLNDKKEYERTFVVFFIPEMEKAWATVSFDPDYKLTMLGSSEKNHEALKAKDVTITGKKLGEWNANWGFEYKVIYEEKDGKVLRHQIFTDGEQKPEEIQVIDINGQKAYQDSTGKEHGEYYIINKDGDLEFWSENGNYYTAKKIS